jgi:hypothetical protein
MIPEMTGRPIPNMGINMIFKSASLIIAAVRVYNAGFCPEISHVYRITTLSVIKL